MRDCWLLAYAACWRPPGCCLPSAACSSEHAACRLLPVLPDEKWSVCCALQPNPNDSTLLERSALPRTCPSCLQTASGTWKQCADDGSSATSPSASSQRTQPSDSTAATMGPQDSTTGTSGGNDTIGSSQAPMVTANGTVCQLPLQYHGLQVGARGRVECWGRLGDAWDGACAERRQGKPHLHISQLLPAPTPLPVPVGGQLRDRPHRVHVLIFLPSPTLASSPLLLHPCCLATILRCRWTAA